MKKNKKYITPPIFAEWIIKKFTTGYTRSVILGDLEEEYFEMIDERGKLSADWWYRKQALKTVPKSVSHKSYWGATMFKNYLKIAFRNIKKSKVFSFINIAGLAVGMACCILILLWVQDELSYDRFHENADYLYREVNHEEYSNGEIIDFAQSPYALAPLLKDEFPEIIDVARSRGAGSVIISHEDKRFSEGKLFFVEPNFFEMFTYSFIKGEGETAFSNPNSIVITEEMAIKYFGDENPVGKIMTMNNQFDFTVTGILENPPKNSHIDFEFLVPIENVKQYYDSFNEWRTWAFTNYILLDKNADYKVVNDKISDVIMRNSEGSIATVGLQPITDIHLHSKDIWGYGGDGDFNYVIIFSIIALFVLLTACINFMNLSTARSSNRAKEVGLRKVVGADKKVLVSQFYSEAFFMSIISMLVSIFLVIAALPFFNDISGKQIAFNILQNTDILLLIIGTTIFTGIVAGSYPALFLSSFQPVKVLSGTLKSGAKGSGFRRVLVITQFSLTIALIIAATVVNKQLYYMRSQKLGFTTEHIAMIRLKGDLQSKSELIKTELKRNRGIAGISAATDPPLNVSSSFIVSEWEGRTEGEQFLSHLMAVDFDFLDLFDLEMAEGRFFSPEFPADTAEAFIINEAALDIMGWKTATDKKYLNRPIIGVIKDFHFKSLHKKIGPITIGAYGPNFEFLFVKFLPGNVAEYIEQLELTWQKVAPRYPMELQFLDERIDRLYRTDQRIEKIINSFTFLLLFIACLGLFGLSSFTAEQKTKEIGIRKTLGASMPGLLILLTKEFIKWIFVSMAIAWPIAYFVMKKFLDNYAYKIDLTWDIFFLASAISILISIITVGYQTIKAAYSNPVDALRYE
ncbi:ABC transporter permease [Bacteroidota bacterium]